MSQSKSRRFVSSMVTSMMGAAGLAAMAVYGTAAMAADQPATQQKNWQVPRTADGHPDLQGHLDQRNAHAAGTAYCLG
jgi:hypothetical protein